jgi:hypothetical protein
MSTKLHGVTSHKILVRDHTVRNITDMYQNFFHRHRLYKTQHNATRTNYFRNVVLCCLYRETMENFLIRISDISHVAPFSVNCMVRIVSCSQEPAALLWAIVMLPVLCHQMLRVIDSIIILPHTPTAIVESSWHIPPKRWYLSTKQLGVTSQKVAFFISAVMRMLNFAKPFFDQPNFYHLHDLCCVLCLSD